MFRNFADLWSQSWVSHQPDFTAKDLPDQTGLVHVVTGGYTGVGFELTVSLLSKGATVFIAGRSRQKFDGAESRFRADLPDLLSPSAGSAYSPVVPKEAPRDGSPPVLHFLQLDLSSLSSVLDAAAELRTRTHRLDVLVNNAGVMFTHPHALSQDGIELQLATNVLGPYLFTERLLSLIQETADRPDTKPGSVRISWAGSMAVTISSLMTLFGTLDAEGAANSSSIAEASQKRNEQKNNQKLVSPTAITPFYLMPVSATNYFRSKVGNVYLASVYGKRLQKRATADSPNRVLSVAFNPGNLKTELTRHSPGPVDFLFKPVFYPASNGGITELASGWAPRVFEADKAAVAKSSDQSGSLPIYVVPWGQVVDLPAQVRKAIENGVDERLLLWCEKMCEPVVKEWETTHPAGNEAN